LPETDSTAEQEIQFFTTGDGVRLAYSIAGSGPPLVRAIDWLNHLDFEWKNPFRRHWFSQIMRHNTLLRYDQRGSGLSDWNVDDFSFERSLADFEELITAVGWDEFAILGSCQGGAIATAYAARHPQRVTKLILVGTFARGWPTPDSMITAHAHPPRLGTRQPGLPSTVDNPFQARRQSCRNRMDERISAHYLFP
jgi:pimeloyl-ACP methyl ester carboxylesterase